MREPSDNLHRVLVVALVVLISLLVAWLGFIWLGYNYGTSGARRPSPAPDPAVSETPSPSPTPSEPVSPEPSETPEPTESPEPSETPKAYEPTQADEEWLLRLVNPWNTMPEGYEPPLAEYAPNVRVDERCLAQLTAMMDDCAAAGCSPYICSAYRTNDFQTRLYENKVAECQALGLDEATARERAGQIVAIPGTSEHQLGLAVDIVDASYQQLDSGQENTDAQVWLMEHCWDYGFILRYPSEKSETTGIIYEPWHYRYVGQKAAAEIKGSGVCLEEYLAQRSDATQASPSPSASAEVSPSPSASAEVSPSPSASAVVSPSPSPSAEVSPSPSASAVVSPSPSPSAEISPEPSPLQEGL